MCCILILRSQLPSLEQALAFTVRSAAGVLGNLGATFLFDAHQFGWGLDISALFAISAVVPAAAVFPSLWYLHDPPSAEPPMSLRALVKVLWALIRTRAVWMTMFFLFAFNSLQLVNPSWPSFQVIGLGFGQFELGVFATTSSMFSFVSMVCYRRWLVDVNFRWVRLCSCKLLVQIIRIAAPSQLFFVTLHVIMIMAFCLYCCAVDPDLCVFHRNIRAIHLPSSGTHNSALDRQPLFNLRYCRAGDCAAVVWLKLAGVPKFQLMFDACAIFVNFHDIMFRVFLEIQLFFRNSFKCTLDRAVSICMTINSRCLARA